MNKGFFSHNTYGYMSLITSLELIKNGKRVLRYYFHFEKECNENSAPSTRETEFLASDWEFHELCSDLFPRICIQTLNVPKFVGVLISDFLEWVFHSLCVLYICTDD